MNTVVSVFARIQMPDGRLLLAVNNGKLKEKGELVLSPLGGNQIYRAEKQDLLAQELGIDVNTGFERPHDLRLVIPDTASERFVQMVAQDHPYIVSRREALLQELTEELTLEELTRLEGFSNITEEMVALQPRFFAVTHEGNKLFARTVFDVTVTDTTLLDSIARAVAIPDNGLQAVSPDIIKAYYAGKDAGAVTFRNAMYSVQFNQSTKYLVDDLIPETDQVERMQ